MHGQLINGVGSTRFNASEFFYTNCEALLPKRSLTMRKTKKQREDATHNGKNRENRSLVYVCGS